jgi:hypothetical protein
MLLQLRIWRKKDEYVYWIGQGGRQVRGGSEHLGKWTLEMVTASPTINFMIWADDHVQQLGL